MTAPVTAASRPDPPRRGIPTSWYVAAVAVATVVLAVTVDPIELSRISRTAVLSLAVLGVTVATGQTGLVSLGHGAFVGLGAFTMATMLDDVGLPFVVAIPVTAVIVAGFGALLGLPALRLDGLQLALVTLGIAVAFPVIARQIPRYTGGVSGRPVETRLEPPGWVPAPFDEPARYRFVVAVVVCAIGFWLAANVVRSGVGRAMRAVRDSPTAASVSGIDLTITKVTSFAFSAALAGTAGALQASLFPFVSHDQFDLFLSLRIYAAAVLGGLAAVVGALIGVVGLIVIPRLNDFLGLFETENLAFGIGLVLLTFLAPGGIVSLLDRWQRGGGEPSGDDGGSDNDDDASGGPRLRPTAAARRLRPG